MRNSLSNTTRSLSIRGKLLAYAGAGLVASMLVYGVVAYATARDALLPSIREQLADDAATVKGGVEELMSAHYVNVRTWSHLTIMRELVIGDVDKTISHYLQAVHDDYGKYLRIAVVDERGICRASSIASDIGRDFTAMLEVDRVDPAVLDRQVPRIAWDPDSRAWSVRMTAAIVNPERREQYLGVLVAMLDRAVLDRIVVPKPGHRQVELRLLDERGRVVAGRRGRTAEGQLDRWEIDGAAASINGTPLLRSGTDSLGREMIVAEVALGAHAQLPELGWRLSAALPTNIALEPVRAVRNRTLLVGALLIGMGLIAAALLAAHLSRPINELTVIAKRIADSGTLESVPGATSRDEVGELTAAFQKMVDAVARAHEEIVQAAKLAFLGEMAAGMAHEIRTPLGIIKSSAQLLERRLTSDPEGSEWAVYIREEADRLNRVVTGLLDLARPAPPNKSLVDVGALVHRAVQFMAGEAANHGVRIHVDAPAGLPPVHCDADQIQQICLNLVLNALQASPAGGSVTVSLRQAGRMIELAVRDEGHGIAPELEQRLFTPFTSKREGGLGLGLTIVRRIVREHGGEVVGRNRESGGAEFVARLPIERTEQTDET